MTKIDFTEDGFYIEQKRYKWSRKTFIEFDNVTGKIGYQRTSSIFTLICGLFLIIYSITFLIKGLSIVNPLIFGVLSIYLIYDSVRSSTSYDILIINKDSNLYFKKNENDIINEIIKKRNVYYYNTYYMSIDSYDLKTKNYTVNWLYKEKVVSKEEIIKTGKFDYNLDEDKFNFIKKEKTSKT